uniref:RING-type domain-containing protein n=1 Tax=viral metagenome TaxID=1070528 RepID=A0A6C0H9N5_9ZZZZ
MSERDFYGRRLNRLNLLNNNDRFILNIYLEMYNQTIHDINMMYEDIDLMYENISELRNIINSITGVSDMSDNRNINRDIDRERNRIRSRSSRGPGDDTENTRRQRRRTDNGENLYDNIHDIFHSANRSTGYDRRSSTIPNVFQRLYGGQSNNRTIPSTRTTTGLGLGDFLLNFYDTVPVYPTRDQINNGTRRVLYSNIENPLNSSCPITLENFDDADNVTQILGCGHIFNHESLTSWFRNHVRCPVCRYDIRNYLPRTQPLIQEINTTRRSSPNRNQQDDNHDGEETKEEENDEQETPLDNSMDQSESSGGTTLQTNANEDPATDDSLINNLSNITENLIQSLLNNNRQSGTAGLYNEIVYNLPYIDPSSNDIVFEGYIQNNYRI